MDRSKKSKKELIQEIDALENRLRELQISDVLLDSSKSGTEPLFRSLFEPYPAIAINVDLNGVITSVNKEAEVILGYSALELIGSNVLKYAPPEEHDQIMEGLKAGLGGRDNSQEVTTVHRDGSRRVFIYNSVPIYHQGSVVGLTIFGMDVSGMKRREEELRQKENQLRLLLENTLDIIYIIGADRKIIYISPQVSAWGYSQEEVIGSDFVKFLHPEDIQKVLDDFKETIETGREFPTVFRAICKDGTPKYMEEFGRAIRKNGELIQLSGIIRNIDERKRAEEELNRHRNHLEELVAERTAELRKANNMALHEITERKKTELVLNEQRNFLRQLIDINPNLIFVKDREGRFELVNRVVADIYGAPEEEIKGKTDADFNPNAEEVENFRRDDLAVMDTLQEKFIPEEPITDSSGKKRWLQTIKRPIIDEDGKASRVLGVSADITARKRVEEALRESEEKFRTIAEQQLLGIYIIKDGRVAFVNDYMAELIGLPREKITSFGPGIFLHIIHPEHREFAAEQARKKLTGDPTAQSQYDLRIFDSNGKLHWWSLNSKPITYQGERAILATVMDITDRKESEEALLAAHNELKLRSEELAASYEQLQHLHDELEKKNKLLEIAVNELEALNLSKTEFLGNVSHELRTPLAAVSGFLELMAGEELGAMTEEQKRAITVSRQNIGKLTSLIENLLTFSSMEKDSPKSRFKLSEINPHLLNALNLIEPLAKERELAVKTSLPKEPVYFFGDGNMLERVFINILSNAVKFNITGGSIKVSLKCPREGIVVSVEDEGIGIKPENIERIFERFYQVDSSATRKYGGAGLGLSIAKDIVELHGGKIKISSSFGEGTKVAITIPLPNSSNQN